ncbi:hypothetical protein ACFWPV_13610 [Streptomyces uncialis]|uniref:hypothetical protein n=1 Tax=Streptomyces uncialis TaxID=1048205 RepID=UPI00365550A8
MESARTLLHLLVRQRGWTYADFKKSYELAAAELSDVTGVANATVEEQTYRRWTSGRVKGTPNRPAPDVLLHMLGYPAALLLGPPPPDLSPAPSAQYANNPNESDLAMTARDAAAHAGEAASLSLPDMTLDQLDDDVMALAQSYGRTSPVELYVRAKDLLGVAQAFLERTQVPRQRTRAYLAAGQSAALLSAASFDLGSLSAAVQLARTAALYGQVIEYGPLQAYAYGALAVRAYWGGRPAEAVRLVRTAQAFSGLGDTALTRLSVIEARAYAHLRNRAATERAIGQVSDHATGARDDLHDEVSGEFGFPPERVAMSNATTYLLVRDAAGAEEAANSALTLMGAKPAAQRSLLVSTQASVDLARARLLRRDLEGAQEALEPVLGIPVEWRAAGALDRLVGFRAELSHPDFANASAASDLGERIEDFSARAAAQRLGGPSPLTGGD